MRGAGITILSGFTGLAIQILATAVLARLLTPSDFGVVTMVTTFSFLLINFGLNGFTEAVVQCESISSDLASTLFWINIGCSLVLTAGFAATGPLLAWFFSEPRVAAVTVGLSVTIFLTGTSVMHLALLKRAMRFADVSFNDVRARAISVVVSIALGWAGWGYWALVAGAVALALSTAVGAWWLCRWLPGRPRRTNGLGSALRFALHTYLSFSAGYGSRNADNLLIGWKFSAQSLGYYKKAYDLFALTATQLANSISVVAVSALSRMYQDKAQYRRYLLSAMAVMALVGMWLGADLTLIGKDLIRLLMGPRWAPAGRIFTFFGPGVGFMLVYSTNGWIHLSTGHPERWLRWTVAEFAFTVALFFIALPHGPEGMAIAWSVAFWTMTVPALWYAGRPIELGLGPILSVIWRFIVASFSAAAATWWIVPRIPALLQVPGIEGASLRIAVITLIVTLLYLLAVVLLYGGVAPLTQFMSLVRDVLSRPAPPETLAVSAD